MRKLIYSSLCRLGLVVAATQAVNVAVVCPASAQQSPIMTIYGRIMDGGGSPFGQDGYQVHVANQRSGRTLTFALSSADLGGFDVTFVDLVSSQAAAVGDRIEIRVEDATGAFVLEAQGVELTSLHVEQGVAEVVGVLSPCVVTGSSATGTNGPGDEFLLLGANFKPGAEVWFGGTGPIAPLVATSGELRVMIPEVGDGLYPVRVVSPLGDECELAETLVPTARPSWSAVKAWFGD